MLHRLREACRGGGILLFDPVEIDETCLGGKEANKHEHRKRNAGRGPAGKQAVVGLRQREGSTQAVVVERIDEETLQALIRAYVQPGSTIYTDEHRSYLGLSDDYTHETVKHSAKEFVNGMAHTNGIESVWAVLKRGFNGVYHHWSTKHCHRYVNEFAFRLNEGDCEVDTIDRIRTLFAGMCGKCLTYAELTAWKTAMAMNKKSIGASEKPVDYSHST